MKMLNEMFPSYNIQANVNLGNYTNTRVGGPADWCFWPKTQHELQQVVLFANEANLPITVLGNASNLVITDDGRQGVVIFLTEMHQIKVFQNNIIAEAGAWIIDVAQMAYDYSLTGLEWAAGIPGSIGGAVFMNAGAYGGQIDQVVQSVDVITPMGEIKTYPVADLAFGYRHSLVQETGDIIISATFAMQSGKRAEIGSKMTDFNERRAQKQPLEFPSCGSVFKRPTGYFAGKLIMDSGLQGCQIGGAQVSTKHAGFIVNRGQATGSDYVNLISHIQDVVYEKFSVNLETEVRILGRK
ncbi:UDP-N-acetylmuramate dehydrogenase [Weissella fangxianensis]|uniref:UDP-N-acetylmuramate dehydrogenase n=1 Tax=Weissella fangxianensis TaxID=2953879 RepID=UPI00215701F2|nr:UDP-N-acetylmuramate dehydrogenase [Weissella fangxianensis]